MKRVLKVVAALIAVAALVVVMLLLIAEAFRNDPLTPSPSAKPVRAPAVQVVGRWV